MRANRGRDTAPEIAVRKIVHSLGLRYRVDYDLAFTRARVAVFIDGCFWHGCPEHHTKAKTNAAYWSEKVQQNRARDAETSELLAAAGWRVLRFWEHEPPADVATIVANTVRAQNGDTRPSQGGSTPNAINDG